MRFAFVVAAVLDFVLTLLATLESFTRFAGFSCLSSVVLSAVFLTSEPSGCSVGMVALFSVDFPVISVLGFAVVSLELPDLMILMACVMYRLMNPLIGFVDFIERVLRTCTRTIFFVSCFNLSVASFLSIHCLIFASNFSSSSMTALSSVPSSFPAFFFPLSAGSSSIVAFSVEEESLPSLISVLFRFRTPPATIPFLFALETFFSPSSSSLCFPFPLRFFFELLESAGSKTLVDFEDLIDLVL
mmetsp:Transcript_30887/g.49531  ORF Transcript_30887/g.49531 Transcript_30887/m.49531 type:complete len:244 (-) Transcript_30887:415-1146(-)